MSNFQVGSPSPSPRFILLDFRSCARLIFFPPNAAPSIFATSAAVDKITLFFTFCLDHLPPLRCCRSPFILRSFLFNFSIHCWFLFIVFLFFPRIVSHIFFVRGLWVAQFRLGVELDFLTHAKLNAGAWWSQLHQFSFLFDRVGFFQHCDSLSIFKFYKLAVVNPSFSSASRLFHGDLCQFCAGLANFVTICFSLKFELIFLFSRLQSFLGNYCFCVPLARIRVPLLALTMRKFC